MDPMQLFIEVHSPSSVLRPIPLSPIFGVNVAIVSRPVPKPVAKTAHHIWLHQEARAFLALARLRITSLL